MVDLNASDLLAIEPDERMELDENENVEENENIEEDKGTDLENVDENTEGDEGTDLDWLKEMTAPNVSAKKGEKTKNQNDSSELLLFEVDLLDDTLPPAPPSPHKSSTPSRSPSPPEEYPAGDIRKMNQSDRKDLKRRTEKKYEEARVLREAREKRERAEKETKASEKRADRQPIKARLGPRPPAPAPRPFLLPTPPSTPFHQ